jgi:predicted phosphatase
MGTVYVEARPKGDPAGARIDDYAVEDHADHALVTFKTQREALEWAKKNGHTPHIVRVRHLNDKKKADHWRAV